MSFNVCQTILLGRTPYLGWFGQAGKRDHEAVEHGLAILVALHDLNLTSLYAIRGSRCGG